MIITIAKAVPSLLIKNISLESQKRLVG